MAMQQAPSVAAAEPEFAGEEDPSFGFDDPELAPQDNIPFGRGHK